MEREYPHEVRLEELRPGDIVAIFWIDASEGRAKPPLRLDAPVVSYGIFVGVMRGAMSKYVVIAKELCGAEIHYNSIPVANVWRVERLSPHRVKLRHMRKLLARLRGRGYH